MDADVIVAGLGAMGSQALWRLARRGVRVIGVEQFSPGHDRGASHGESRIIRSAYAEGAAYVPLIRRAWELWRELERVSEQALVERTGGLMIGAPGSEIVAGSLASAETHGLGYELLTPDELRRRFPQHRVADGLAGLYEEAAGVVRPEAAVRAAVRTAVSLGAEVRTGAVVTEVVADPDRPGVRLGGELLTARHLVVALGSWLPRLVPGVAGQLAPVRRVMGWFRPADAAVFAPAKFPIFVREDERFAWYGFPSMDRETVKVALHQGPDLDEPVDPAAGPRPPDETDAARLAEVVSGALPGLRTDPVRMKECTYTKTPDEHFLVGRRPELPGLTLLGGFSGHGFKFAPALGEVAAQLALTGRTDLPIEIFDPLRF